MSDNDTPLMLFGAGAHARVLIEAMVLSQRSLFDWILDDNPALHGTSIDGRAIHAAERIFELDPASIELVNAVGSVGLPTARQTVYERFTRRGYRFATVIHPFAIVSPSATIAEGAQLMAGCVIQTNATIGLNTLINTRAGIDHDCTIGDHCHFAPGVTLSGNVTVGEGCHIGTGAVVIQGVSIGPGSFVAAGSVVTKDLPPDSNVRGVPAKPHGESD